MAINTAEPSALLSLEEKNRALYHLGYPVMNPIQTISLGIPSYSQPMWLAASALERIPLTMVGMVRQQLAQLDTLEAKLREAPEFMISPKVGEVEVDIHGYADNLEKEYCRWARRLADLLAAPLNPYSARFGAGAGQVALVSSRSH